MCTYAVKIFSAFFFFPSCSIQFLQHNSKAEGSELIEVVCKAYTGPNKPEACGQL